MVTVDMSSWWNHVGEWQNSVKNDDIWPRVQHLRIYIHSKAASKVGIFTTLRIYISLSGVASDKLSWSRTNWYGQSRVQLQAWNKLLLKEIPPMKKYLPIKAKINSMARDYCNSTTELLLLQHLDIKPPDVDITYSTNICDTQISF